jgi:peptide-methionine (R)-S-oxide reductase
MKYTLLTTLSAMALTVVACQSKPKELMETASETPVQPNAKVEKSEEEWKAQLTPEQFRVARKHGTEPPNGPIYKQFKAQGEGTYYCIGCDAELFSSKEKFDSRSGWPSFYDPSNAKNIATKTDTSAGMVRTEVLCSVCGAHLGHVFKGEGFNTPTDKRYCVNGILLKFVPKK